MSNYIVEAFKKMALLESEDISLDADGLDKLSGFMDEAGVDPDEESVDVYDLEAEAQDDLKDSYIGKVVCECSVCHSHVFFDKTDMSEDADSDADGLVCYDIECPYCMSNEGYILIGEIAPYNQEESDELQNPDEAEDEEEIPAVDVEGAADDVDEEDLEESYKRKGFKESWEHEFEAEYDSIQNDPSLTDEQKKEYLKKLFAEFSMNEELKLDGVKELYDNDEIRGEESLEGVDKLEGVKELHGEKHEAPINEAIDDTMVIEHEFAISDDEVDDVRQELKEYNIELVKAVPNSSGFNYDVALKGKKADLKKWIIKDYGNVEEAREFFPELFESLKSKKRKNLKEGLDDIIEYEADFDPNLDTLEEYKEMLKSYGLKFIKQDDYNGWNPYVVFKGSKKNIIAFLTSDFYGETEESLREEDPSLFESLKSKRNKKSLKENIEDVTVTTEDETMTMTTKEDGGVVIETSPVEEPIDEMPIEGGDEMIVPLSDESSDEIDAAIDANSVEEGEDAIDMEELAEEPVDDFDEFEDFDEESFNGLGESYLRSCYENVSSFKTTGASVDGKKLIIEGMIKFDSGNIKETEFVFESIGKGKFEGYNKQISRGKKTYRLNTSVKNNKLVCEALNYNYRSRNELNESVRVYGTVKRK